jgi:hypothetical protein
VARAVDDVSRANGAGGARRRERRARRGVPSPAPRQERNEAFDLPKRVHEEHGSLVCDGRLMRRAGVIYAFEASRQLRRDDPDATVNDSDK